MKNVVRKLLGHTAIYKTCAPYYRTLVRVLLFRPVPRDDQYNAETLAVMRKVLRPDTCCIDVGANRGAILKLMCSLAPVANHIAIEPIPGLAAELSKNFPKIRVINAALADYSGRSSFKYVQNHDALSGLRERHYDVHDVRIIEIQVEVLPLDALSAGSGRYGFIKIDCEGGEYHVLKGARETILRDRPVIVFEAGANSTGTYGVTASMLYSLVCDEYKMKLSTMKRWLSQSQDFTREEFINNWGTSSGDYYFIAHP